MTNTKSLIVCSIIVLMVYMATLFIPQGIATYLIGAPAFVVIGLTSLARANSIKHDLITTHWNVRRMGFAVTGSLAFMYLFGPLLNQFPSWRSTLMAWGVAFVWLTTPGMPPWWLWITGEWENDRLLDRVKSFYHSLFGR